MPRALVLVLLLACQALAGPKEPDSPKRKADDLLRDLLGLVEWRSDAKAAVARAKEEKKLALALVRASHDAAAPNDNEEIFLAATFAHPSISALIREQFVPTRVFYPGWTYTYGKVREPDPLAAMGTSASAVKPLALVVADGDGRHLGTLEGMGTFDAAPVAAFLYACLARAGIEVPETQWPLDHEADTYWRGVKKRSVAHEIWKQLPSNSPWRYLVRAWEAWPERMAMYAGLRIMEGHTKLTYPFPAPEEKQHSTESRADLESEDILVGQAVGYLLRQQQPSGAWPTAQPYAANTPGVTALCARALHLWAPRLPEGTRKAAEASVVRARDWCLQWMADTDPEKANSFGTTYVLDLFLDLYAADLGFKRKAQGAVAFHERGQAPNGGWGYDRTFAVNWKGGFGGWPVTDQGRVHSMNTGPALLVLARAKAAGLEVDQDVLARGTKALLAMKDGPAVFTYTWPEPRNFNKLETSIGRACACEHALVELGAAPERDLDLAVATFLEHRDGLRRAAKVSPGWMPPYAVSSYFQFFAYHHAARAIQRLSESQRAKRLALLRDDLLGCVELDGTWVDYLGVGKPYGTAMALMVLRWAPLQ